jgi:hypothetical protein
LDSNKAFVWSDPSFSSCAQLTEKAEQRRKRIQEALQVEQDLQRREQLRQLQEQVAFPSLSLPCS